MNNKRRNQPHRSTKQALSLTSRQRAYRQRLPDEKPGEDKTTDKAKANKR